MRNFFVFNGKNSKDFGLYISGSGTYGGPARSYETVEVPGRNGLLYFDNGRYENVEYVYNGAFIYEDFRFNVEALRAWLYSPNTYCRLEDTYHLDEYRMAICTTEFDPEVWHDLSLGQFDLTFDCKPQRFLKSGEYPIGFARGSGKELVLHNRTMFEARPWIRAYGSGTGKIYVNDQYVEVSGVTDYVDVDSDLMEIFKGNTSLNPSAKLHNGEFPVLKPGKNTIRIDGFHQLEIKPRWWTL